MSVEQLARHCADIGFRGIDLVGPEHFATLRQYHLVPTMLPSHDIVKGLNREENHAECLNRIRAAIDSAAEISAPNVICFSGNREGLDDQTGLRNCARAIEQVIRLAESRNVTLCIELLNSKRNHADYMCDRTAWAAQLVRSIASAHFKLVYDIYHMQIQEGDVIATINEFKDCIGHYHTGGVPGRNEIDQTQELNYPAIIKAIASTNFTGWVAHEFIPTGDPIAAMKSAFQICNV